MTMKLGIEQGWINRFLEIKDMRVHFSSVIRRAGLRLAERNLRVSARRICGILWLPCSLYEDLQRMLLWGWHSSMGFLFCHVSGISTHMESCGYLLAAMTVEVSLYLKKKRKERYIIPQLLTILYSEDGPEKLSTWTHLVVFLRERTMACSYDH